MTMTRRQSRWSMTAGIGMTLALAIAGLMALANRPAVAQSGTPNATPGASPAAVSLPVTPGAADCTVDPMAYGDLPLLSAPENSLNGPPTPPPGGQPGDARAQAAVTDTLRIQIGCVNAGDIPRALALAGPEYTQSLFRDIGAPDEAQYATLATPSPVPDQAVVSITAIDDVQMYPDGSLSARVTTNSGIATTVNDVLFTAAPESPTGYVIRWLTQVSTTSATPQPSA